MGLFNYAHLPAWLENNWLFRKGFLLRKLFLTRRKFSHYAQFAEDVAVIRQFHKGYKGIFVDVGCFHPVKYNNTYRLYRKGWRGVNIDIDKIKIEGFNMVRRGDVNIARAVSSETGEFTYWSNGFYSLTITLDEAFAAGKPGYRKKVVKADTLTNILDGTKYKGRQIDFLSVDAEGHDFEVLRSLDFERYAPRLIAVETHYPTFDEVKNDALYQLLTGLGYVLANWVGLTLLFRRKGDEVLRETTT
ncbi:MAG: FkbM family methyltransferase [Phaeodactylibacter sp.]|nr:FkbM family methyltransferase [Phaeodactylibacter sp.]